VFKDEAGARFSLFFTWLLWSLLKRSNT